MIELVVESVITITVTVIDTPPIACCIVRDCAVRKRKRTIDIVYAATIAKVSCCVVRDHAIAKCKWTAIIENTSTSKCCVAKDPAVDDSDRTSVIADTTAPGI